jgi:N utilization substance protein A
MSLETFADLESAIHRYFQHNQVEIETRRKELGVTDALKDVPGIIAPMLVPLGKSKIRTVEDLAACATDDLYGWAERKGRRMKRHQGILQDVAVSREECDAIILRARALVGWIDEPESAPRLAEAS